MLDGIKSRLNGNQGRRKRYASEEAEEAQLSDSADAETFEDETRQTIFDKVMQYRWFLLAAAIAALPLVFFFSRTFLTIVPRLVNNIWFQRLTAAGILVGGSYYLGRRHQIGVWQDLDWLVIYDAGSNTTTRYFGHFEDSREGSYPVFRPVKGFSRLGNPSEHYTISDLSPELANKVGREGQSQDDDVLIRLHPSLARATRTDTGTVITQLGAGVKADPTGTETHLEVKWPELADEDSLQDVTDELEDQQEQKEYYKDKLETVRSQRDDLLDEHDARAEEEVEQFLDRLNRVGEAMHATQRKRQQDDSSSESNDSAPDLDSTDYEQ